MANNVDNGALTTYLRADMKDLSSKLKRATRSIRNFSIKTEARIRQASQVFKTIGASVKRMTATVSRHMKRLGVVIAGTMAASIKVFGDFDSAMTKSLAIMSDITPKVRKEMELLAKEISGRSVTSAKELADSYYYLASAGLSAKQSIEALPIVERFAVAGMFDMAKATDLVTDAQSALGLTVADTAQNTENMIRVSDTLVEANTLANASVEQFAEALTADAGASMKNYNIALEEGVSVLAAYADQGKKAAEAGNMFGRMLRLLIKSAEGSKEAWKDFGFSIYQDGELKPMSEIIRGITDGLEGMTTQQKAAQLEMLGFTALSQKAILPLLGMGDAIEEYNNKLVEMQGTTEELYNKQLKSFNSAMKVVWNNIKLVMIRIGESLAPSIRKLGEWFVQNRESIEQWAAAFADEIVFVGQVVSDFFKLMDQDYHKGFQALMDSLIAVFEAFAKTVLNLSYRVGQGILKGIKEGLFAEDDKLTGQELTDAAMRAYAKENPQYVLPPDPSKPLDEQRRKRLPGDPNWAENWKKAEETAQRQYKSKKIDSVFKGFLDDVKFYYDEALEDIKGSSKEAAEIIDKRLEERAEKNQKLLADIWKNRGLIDMNWGLSDVFGVNITNAPWAEIGETKPKRYKRKIPWDKSFGLSDVFGVNLTDPAWAGKNMPAVGITPSKTEKQKEKEAKVTRLKQNIETEIDLTSRMRNLNDLRERSAEFVRLQIAAEDAYGKQSQKTIHILDEYKEKLKDLEVARDMAEMADRIGSSFASAFESAIFEAKKFGDVMKGLLQDISREMFRTMISKPIGDAISSAVGSMFSTNANVAHTGGIVGSGMAMRKVPAGYFGNAPRLHSGLKADEFPAILQRGEEVIPADQAGKGGNVEVNVINQTSQPVQAEQGKSEFDGEKFVTNVVLKDLNNYGAIRNTIQGLQEG